MKIVIIYLSLILIGLADTTELDFKKRLETYKDVILVCVLDDHYNEDNFTIKSNATVISTFKGEAKVGDQIRWTTHIGKYEVTKKKFLSIKKEKGNLMILFADSYSKENEIEVAWTESFLNCRGFLEIEAIF